jgi:hypothetical protein
MESGTTNRSSGKIYYIIIILILLGSNGIFIYNYFTTDKKLVHTEEELFATDSVRMQVEKLLNETDNELDLYKGKNAELDAFLKEKNDSLQEYADRIQLLLRQNRLSKSQLEVALTEIDQLRYYKRKYLNQIDSLSTRIDNLNRENSTLKQNIDQEKRKNDNLNMENIRLSNKVAIGAKLKTNSIYITGIKMRGNGKERETSKVSQIEKIKISFNLEENYVNEPGTKDLYIKIVGPEGTTLYNEAAGSGTFKFQGQDNLYSTKVNFEFKQEGQSLNIYWSKGSDYAPGKYKAELFCDGFLIGSGEFDLK